MLFDSEILPADEMEQKPESTTQMSPITEEIPSLPNETTGTKYSVESPKQDDQVSSDKTSRVGDESDICAKRGICERRESNVEGEEEEEEKEEEKEEEEEDEEQREEESSYRDSAFASSPSIASAKDVIDEGKASDSSKESSLSETVCDYKTETNARENLHKKDHCSAAELQNSNDFQAENKTKNSDVTFSREQRLVLANGPEKTSFSAKDFLESGQQISGVGQIDGRLGAHKDISLSCKQLPYENTIGLNASDYDTREDEASFRQSSSDDSVAVTQMKNELAEASVTIPCAEECLA